MYMMDVISINVNAIFNKRVEEALSDSTHTHVIKILNVYLLFSFNLRIC